MDAPTLRCQVQVLDRQSYDMSLYLRGGAWPGLLSVFSTWNVLALRLLGSCRGCEWIEKVGGAQREEAGGEGIKEKGRGQPEKESLRSGCQVLPKVSKGQTEHWPWIWQHSGPLNAVGRTKARFELVHAKGPGQGGGLGLLRSCVFWERQSWVQRAIGILSGSTAGEWEGPQQK